MISIIGGSGFVGSGLARILFSRQVGFWIGDLVESANFAEKTEI